MHGDQGKAYIVVLSRLQAKTNVQVETNLGPWYNSYVPFTLAPALSSLIHVGLVNYLEWDTDVEMALESLQSASQVLQAKAESHPKRSIKTLRHFKYLRLSVWEREKVRPWKHGPVFIIALASFIYVYFSTGFNPESSVLMHVNTCVDLYHLFTEAEIRDCFIIHRKQSKTKNKT